ncbi:head maturation protease, ClpP-related [Streptomyces ossamyceticus]|uniref:head maturation protease, ClpP-related n=2 Tax=Streptomyces ossamyceticus TaxID=249581 RepID=UPI003EC11C14
MRPALPTPDGSETWYRVTNALDEGGTPYASISIYGDIGSWGITAAAFVDELKAIDAPEIRLNINSPGGEVFDGLAIHSALRSHRAKVLVQVDSLAASIASVIAMAGDRITVAPHAQFMVHDAQGVAVGDPEELREYAEFLDRQSDNIASVYAERAGGTVKQWRARMKATTWYFADEAVAAGLADEVAKPQRMTPEEEEQARATAAAWDLSVYNYAHTSREEAPAPPTAEPETPPAVEPPAPALPMFDPDAFRAAAVAALDPMPGYQPDHMRSLMAGVANDAPAAPEPARPETPYVPRPADTAPEADPEQVAVAWFRSVFQSVANDAPAEPPPAAPAPVAEAPQVVHVPEPPRPADEVAVDYMRTLMANAANDLAAPEQAAAPGPTTPVEPIPAIDRNDFERSLREAQW